MSVAAIILGAGHREAITEPVELLGIDGKDHKTMLEQHLHHRAVRRLDRHRDLSRCSLGLLEQPITQLGQSGSAMREVALTGRSSFGIQQANAMALRCPIDPDEPLHVVDHCWISLLSKRANRDPDRSLYWRSRRKPPIGSRSRPLRRGAVPTQVLKAQVDKAAPGGSARETSLHQQTSPTARRVQGGLAERNPPSRKL